MAHTLNALKRLRQSERRRRRNRARKSAIRTYSKRVLAAVRAGDAHAARSELARAFKAIDKAVQRGVIHRNTGARRKSALARAVAGMSAAATPSG